MEDLDNNNSLEDKDDKNSEYFNSENSNQINYIKTHTSLDEKTVNENNYDITSFNDKYEMRNKINVEKEDDDEEKEDDENDLSSEDEYEYKLNNIKYGILKIKLNILSKIIISKIQK